MLNRLSFPFRFTVLGALLLAVVWAAVVVDLRLHARREAADVRGELERSAQIGAQALQSSVRAADLLLLNLRDHWTLNRASFPDLVTRTQIQSDLGGGFNVTVAGADGRVLFSTWTPDPAGVSLGDREHFRILRDGGADQLVISGPLRSRMTSTAQWLLGFARPLATATGRFEGIIVVTFTPSYLSRLFESIDFGEGASVAVFREDATLLMRAAAQAVDSPDRPSRLLLDYPTERTVEANLRAKRFFEDAGATSYTRFRSGLDQVERMFASRPVGNYPLRFTVGRAVDNIDRGWAVYRQRYLAFGAVVSAVGLGVLYLLLRARQAREAATRQRLDDIERLRRSEERLTASQRSLRSLSSRQMALKEAERKRVAQEVHDELGQRLTVLRMELSMLPRAVAEDPARLLPERVDRLKSEVDDALAIARDIAGRLRPAALDLGLGLAAEGLLEEFQHCLGVPCELDNRLPDGVALDETRTTAAFRILQEALTNAARHAEATRIDVALEVEGEELCIDVRDNGRGFVAPAEGQNGSLGLSGMRERAAALGGRLELHSAPGQGTRLRACLPLAAPVRPASLLPVNHDPLATVHSE